MNTNLQQAVERVRVARALAAEYGLKVKTQMDAAAELIADDIALANQWKQETEAAEADCKALALVAYTADPTNKKPADGVGIQVRITRTYDAAAALAWAKEKGMCLIPEQLDVKAFDKIAAATPLPFVTTKEAPTVTLASALPEMVATSTQGPF